MPVVECTCGLVTSYAAAAVRKICIRCGQQVAVERRVFQERPAAFDLPQVVSSGDGPGTWGSTHVTGSELNGATR